MKSLFYPKFALSCIQKNKKFYIPYIATSVLWIMMFYILITLPLTQSFPEMRGSSTLTLILQLGTMVIGFFSLIFFAYTNSFLTKQRNKEFALYSILGMNNKNLSLVIFFEVFFVACITFAIGLFLGVLLLKIFELLLINIINTEIHYNFYISFETIKITLITYSIFYALICLHSIIKVRKTNTIELLKSQNTGEKAPKANILFGLVGVILLGIGYWMAITTENTFRAINVFFIAVLFVIAGTYVLFTSLSVIICKRLQKSKKYYKTNNFISISSLVFRMKRNGAGLASICILCTMVLVMISSTFSLYAAKEDNANAQFPQELELSFGLNNKQEVTNDFVTILTKHVHEATQKWAGNIENDVYFTSLYSPCTFIDNKIGFDSDIDYVVENVCMVSFYSLSDYNRIFNKNIQLQDNEVIQFALDDSLLNKTITIHTNDFIVTDVIDEFIFTRSSLISAIPSIVFIVNDLATIENLIGNLTTSFGLPQMKKDFTMRFDTGLSDAKQIALQMDLDNLLVEENGMKASINVTSRANSKTNFYELYGGLFFIGIVLSILFIAATVLIMYYKQIVEGYEDSPRFATMQKIGLTEKEIKQTINTQMRTVFFVPLVFAALHLAFAFPLISQMLTIFGFTNIVVFASATIICYLIFAVLYAIVYKATSKTYYEIVK